MIEKNMSEKQKTLRDEAYARKNLLNKESFEGDVERKIQLLYDFCILTTMEITIISYGDERENILRSIFLSLKTSTALDRAIHNVVLGKEKLDNFICRYEKKLCKGDE